MTQPHIAAREPKPVELEAAKDYWWCACGQSKNQPFCDGSHKGGAFTPVQFKLDKAATKYLCMCKQSKNKPFCDGSHKAL
jgi:CDGSH-type Zn-finger protein